MPSKARTTSGTMLSASAALPATYDEAGYSVLTYTSGDTCEIVNIGTVSPFTWNTTENNTVCDEPNAKKKSSKTFETFTATINYVKGDPLQDVLEQAFHSRDDVISLRIKIADDDYRWCTAQVTKFPTAFGGKDDYITRDIEFEPQTEWKKSA